MYNAYPNTNAGQMPVRYAVPQGYRQPSPPYANQSFDRYAGISGGPRPPPGITQPIRYPPGYGQGYYPPIAPTQAAPTSPRAQRPQRQSVDQLQPPNPYYYNPNASPGPKAVPPKKGGKEYKDNAFTIAPDGAHNESIKGLVSNNDINNLLKHKGTKVKISKIYRITKTKPTALNNDSSDEEIPLPKAQQPTPAPTQMPVAVPPPPPPPAPAPVQQRPVSSSSSDSHCSTCSYCSCSDCRHRTRSHTYDDCPECRAERDRERARRRRRRRRH